MSTFEITFTKREDGLIGAEVRLPAVPQAGVIVSTRGFDGDAADRHARIKTLDFLMALAEAGEDLPPEVEALFARRFA